MSFSAWFACINGCPTRHSLEDVLYRCPDCGDLLEVVHDVDALKQRSADEWKALFDSRYRRAPWPYASGVWGKKEWVHPGLDDANIVSTMEGASSLFRADLLARQVGCRELWIKQCGQTHTGSFKDLGMTVLVSAVNQMRARGKPIRAVACASTGDTSAALSAYAAAAGIPAVVLLPKAKISTAQLAQPLANGALVLSLETDFDGCMKVVQELAKDPTVYLANSMNSLRIEGQKTLSIEICQQLDWSPPDWVVIPGGNLGNVSALGRGFELMKALGLIDRLPRIAVAQAANAGPLFTAFQGGYAEFAPVSAKRTLASAIQIGDPVSVKKAIRALKACNGVVAAASEDALANAAAQADLTGTYADPHTGVALAATFELLRSGTISASDRVVVVSTAHGLKFTEFKVGYHEGTLEEVTSRYRNRPVEVGATFDAVRGAIERFVG